MKVNLILKAYDSLSGVVKKACRESDAAFEKTNKTLEAAAGKFDKIGQKAAIAGGALVGMSAVNAKVAGDFEVGMNNVSTLIDTGKEDLKAMGQEVLNIGKNSPKAISDLTDGLYSIRSAGIDAADQFKVLSGSEKLSVAGLSTTAEAVSLATGAINAFALEGEQQNKIYDVFFKAVKYGTTTVSEFSQGFGAVAGVVSSAGIKIDEYSAAVAALTANGIKANIVHTQMKAVIAGLSRGSKEQTAVFNKLGAKTFKDLIQKSGGVVNALDRIYKTMGGNDSALIQLVGSVEAYNAIQSLQGKKVKNTFENAFSAMRNGANAIDEAYTKQLNGLNAQMAVTKNNVQALSIKFGNGLLPVIKAVGGGARNLTALFDKMPEPLTNFISIAGAGLGAALLAFGGGALAVGSFIKNLIFLRNVVRGTSIAMWAMQAPLAPIIGITAGIIALGAGAVYCYKRFEGFRNVCNAAGDVLKLMGANIALAWQWTLNLAGGIWNFIKPAVKFTGTILSWVTPIGQVIRLLKKLWETFHIGDKVGEMLSKINVSKWATEQKARVDETNENLKAQRTNTINDSAASGRGKNAKVNGSHASGLDYVPFNGYVAELHKGEAVLSAPEASSWRTSGVVPPAGLHQSGAPAPAPQVTLNYNPQITINGASTGTKEEFTTLLRRHKEEILRLVEDSLRRREARAY